MATTAASTTSVFISYSHDSDAHATLVSDLATQLKRDGFLVTYDQDLDDAPPAEGWPKWMATQIALADVVLVICSARFYRLVLGNEEAGKGNGTKFESTLTFQEIADAGSKNKKFIPVLVAGGKYEDIPNLLRSWWNDYDLSNPDAYARLSERLRKLSDPKATPEHVSTSSVYVTYQISELVLKYLNDAGFEIYDLPFDWDLTVDDLVNYCSSVATELSHDTIRALIQKARGFAFDAKYANNTYDNNSRGIGDFWKREIREVMASLDAPDFLTRPIIDVGIGNGIEASGLLDGARNLTLVDIAPESLSKAETLVPKARSITAAAESLAGVKTASQDIYLSCRTYQSSYFGVSEALREAYRVVRPGGLVVISVANGYVGDAGGLIPGMLIPRSSVVSRDRPFEVADKIRRRLTLLRFEGIGIRTGVAEVYVYGRRGR